MRFGCLLGGLATFTPSLICGLTGFWLVGVLRHWLESWEKFSLNVLGQNDKFQTGRYLRFVIFPG